MCFYSGAVSVDFREMDGRGRITLLSCLVTAFLRRLAGGAAEAFLRLGGMVGVVGVAKKRRIV